MPLGPGVRYRYKTNPDGSKVRLAFRGNKVIEVKPEGGSAKMVGNAKTRGSVRGVRREHRK